MDIDRRVLIRAAALLAVSLSTVLPACRATGDMSVKDMLDSGWDESRRDTDTRMIELLQRREYRRAVDLADSIAQSSGGDPRLKAQKAEALGGMGRTDEAVELFEESLRDDYAVCETHLNFAVLLLETGKTGRALTELNEAKMFCGQVNMPVINRNLAVVRIKRGEEEAAMEAVKEGLGYSENDPYLLGLKAMLIAESNPVLAETLFVKSEKAGGMTPDFQYQLGLLLLRTSEPARAVRPLGAAMSADPGNEEIKYNYAEALARSGRPQEAEQVLEGMLDGPWGEKASRRLARLLFQRDDYERALEIFRALPETPENLDRVAMCLHRLGRTGEAVVIQRKVVDERPQWPTGMINLAVMLGSMGELDEAESLLVKALELDPDNVTATVNLDSLRRARAGSGR